MTGFTGNEYSTGGKWFELLREMTPHVKRVAVLWETAGSRHGPGRFAAMPALAPSHGLELPSPCQRVCRKTSDIERALTGFARDHPSGGMVASGTRSQSEASAVSIIALAAKHRIPAVYNARFLAAAGGLISYGADLLDHSVARRRLLTAFSRARAQPIYPSRRRRGTRSSSISRPPRRRGIELPVNLVALADEVIDKSLGYCGAYGKIGTKRT